MEIKRSGLHPLQTLIAGFHSLRSDRRALRSQDIFLNFAGRRKSKKEEGRIKKFTRSDD
jgi:hypothetical protein